MQLIYLVSFIVLLPVLVLPEVIPPQIAAVTPFDYCTEFFAELGGHVTFPTIFNQAQYKQICQKQKNKYEFATLYNTKHRIPVYSAYLYQGKNKCDRKSTWYIEPQLDDPKYSAEMAPEKDVKDAGENQALNEDYEKSGYNRGHLYPVFHTFKQCTADATFTLTNAAPQSPRFNQVDWLNKVEKATKNFLDTYCIPEHAYVVTGVVPGTETMKNRVNIPSFFWSAYCCLDASKKPAYSAAFISPNKNVKDIENITVADLDSKLSDQNHYNLPFSVFQNRC